MNKLLYISTGLPKEEVERLREKQYDFSSNAIMPIATFHGNILAGLAAVYDDVRALSGVPISRKNFKVLRYGGRKIKNGNLEYRIPGFFNLPVLKQLTITVKTFFGILGWCLKNKKENRHIVIDGTYTSGLIALQLASRFVKVSTGAIIVDYYSFMDPRRETPAQQRYYKLLQSIDGFVFVTDHLEKLVNLEHKKFMIMEGLVDGRVETAANEPGDYCLYAGGLHDIYGVKELVDAFHATDLPYALHLYGNGNLVEYIKEVGETDPRIVYKGVVSHDELLEIERGAKLLVNPRPVHGELDTRYNFPSKLMEYMQSGRPVMTTRLLGIPKEYDSCMYFFEGDTAEELREGMEAVLAKEEAELSAFGQQAQAYVNENKNNAVTAKRIFDLMNTNGGA